MQEIEDSADVVEYGPLVRILIELCTNSDAALIKEKTLIWLHKFLIVGREKLLPYHVDLLACILPCVAHKHGCTYLFFLLLFC